jgi:acyl-CoA reductase-like NAD-dependent aldehyde dehydrogenase
LDWACSAVPLLVEGSTLVCVAPRTAALAVLRAARCAGVLPAGVLNVLVAAPEGVAAALGDAFLRQYGKSAGAGVAGSRRDTVFVSSTAGLDLTLSRAVSLRLFHNGQRAGQSARIYVEEQIAHELADRLHQYLAFLECGDPRNPVTDLGPLRSSAALQRAEDQVASALRHGTLLKLGGRRYQPWGLRGYFFQPTLMVEGRGAERAPVEEIPGPVVLVSPVRGLVEAVRHEPAGGIAFFGHDAEVQLRSLTAARVDFTVGNIASPIERIMHSFRGAPKSPVRIETVTSERGARLADRACAAPT